MKRVYLSFLVLLFAIFQLSAQTYKVVYEYDHAGNRVSRVVISINTRAKSVDDEIKEQEKKLEELHQMRHALQHNAKEAYEAVYGKTDEATEVKHTTVEEMEKELHENVEHQMEYVNELKNKSLKK